MKEMQVIIQLIMKLVYVNKFIRIDKNLNRVYVNIFVKVEKLSIEETKLMRIQERGKDVWTL